MATSVLRRYTPPTCTLEIAATGSALARWTDRTLLKNLRFQLHFDDPKLPEEQQVTIKGDRTQLEALCEAVSNYVQKQLSQTSIAPAVSMAKHDVTSAIAASLEQLKTGENKTGENGASSLSDTGVYLQPKGLTSHTLHLGNLVEGDKAKTVPLSATQLFDLANALDEYTSEADALPDLGRPKGIKSPATWGKIAAGVVLAAGTTIPLAMFVRQVSNPAAQVANREVQMTTANAPAGSVPTLPPPPAPLSTSPSLKLEPIAPPGTPGALVPVTPSGGAPSIVAASPALPAPALPPENLPQVPVNSGGSTFDIQESAQPAPPSSMPVEPAVPETPQAPSPTLSQRQRALEAANPPPPDVAAALSQADTALNPSTSLDFSGASGSSARSAAPSANVAATVKASLQSRWQPIQGVTQDLQYNVNLSADGAVQEVIPKGDTSAANAANVPLPTVGQVIAPNPSGQPSRLLVVFSPNGAVSVIDR
jgi:hypothetical protein